MNARTIYIQHLLRQPVWKEAEMAPAPPIQHSEALQCPQLDFWSWFWRICVQPLSTASSFTALMQGCSQLCAVIQTVWLPEHKKPFLDAGSAVVRG